MPSFELAEPSAFEERPVSMQLVLEIFRSAEAGDPFAFRAGFQEYVLRTSLGGAETATLDWDESLLSELAAVRRPGRDAAVVQRVAERLRRFLSATSFAQRETEIRAAVARKEQVQLTLRFAAAELFALPWELLSEGASGQFLGALPGVLLRYAWPDSETAAEAPQPRAENGRILFAWSASAGAVPAAEQLAAIERASQLGHHPFSSQRDVLPNVSYARLDQALRSAADGEPISVLHLLCHGARLDSTFGLAWNSDTEAGSADLIDAVRLRQLLAPHVGTLRLVVLSACDSGNSGQLGNQLGSLAQALHRIGIAAVVASRFPLSANGSVLLTEEIYKNLLYNLSSLEISFISARERLLAEPNQLDWASLQLYARPEDGDDTRPIIVRPYRGLEPFLASHSRFLFGRERERQSAKNALETLAREHKPRFLVVAGASGTGKSSVVLGGLLPDLSGAPQTAGRSSEVRRLFTELTSILDEKTRTKELRQALEVIASQLEKFAASGPWEWAVMRPGDEPLVALEQALRTRRDTTVPFLLCVDQFEELFTHIADATRRESFARRLWALAKEPTGVHIVITLRVDFLGHCGELILDENGLRLDRVAYAEEHRVFIAQLEPAQLAAAIRGPARLVGLELAPALVAQMISEVEGEPGALPLLEYVLDLLWQKREGRQLTSRCYEELSGVSGALGRNADRVLASLSSDDQRLARQLLVRLVNLADKSGAETRRRVALRRLREQIRDPRQRLDAVLAAFVDARLLVRSEDEGQSTIEVAHEALIRKWPRLSGWLVEDRQRLTELRELEQWAEQYASFRTLLRGSQLGYALRILNKYPDELGTVITDMIRSSLAAQRRQRLGFSTAIIIALCALSGLSLLARTRQKQAVAEREVALNKERIAASRLLATRAERVQQLEPDLALLLAGRAFSMHREFSSKSVLFGVLERTRQVAHFLRGPRGRVPSLSFSPDGQRLAAASLDSGVWIYDSKRGDVHAHLAVAEKTPLHSIMWSPDGLLLAAGNANHIYLWDMANPQRPPQKLPAVARTIYSIGFSAGSDVLAAGTEDGRVLLWNVAERRALKTLMPEQTQLVASIKFVTNPAPDGKGQLRLLIGGSAGSVSVFDAASHERLLGPLPTDKGVVSSVAASPDGKLLAAGSEDRAVLLWDGETGAPRGQPLVRHDSAVSCVRFSPDGKLLASFSIDRAIQLWDPTRGASIGPQLGVHAAPIYSCAWGRDDLLASGSDDSILLWDLANHPAVQRTHDHTEVSALAVDPLGRRAVLGSPDGQLRFWELAQPRPGPGLKAHAQAVNSVAWSASGDRVVSGGGDTVQIWDAQKLQEVRHFREGGHGSVMAAALSSTARGELLAAGYADGTLVLWHTESGKLAAPPVAARQQSITSLSFLPGGDGILTGGLDGTIRVWERDTLTLRCTAPPFTSDSDSAHGDAVTALAIHPNSRVLASAGRDRRILLWDLPPLETNTRCLSPQAELPLLHKAGVTALKWSGNGATLASGGEDAAVVLWDLEARQPIGQPLLGHLLPITALAFSHDGFLISTDEESVQRWDTVESHWPARVCARANRNLSLKEWQSYLGERPYCKSCAELPAGVGAPPSAPPCKD